MSKIPIEGQKPKKEESRLDEFPDLGIDAVKRTVEPLTGVPMLSKTAASRIPQASMVGGMRCGVPPMAETMAAIPGTVYS